VCSSDLSLTDNQLQKIIDYQKKDKLTDNQAKELAELLRRKNAPPGLSDSCITHLADVYVANKYNRQTNIETKFTIKGLMVEEDSLTLYSRYKQRFFTKNEERLNNEWISGCTDVTKELVIDIKSSWDIFTFFRQNVKKLNKLYYWQMQGYMDLTGVDSATLAYCLTDTPDVLIEDAKRKLLWKMGVATELNADYIEACTQLEKTLTYGDIPLEERIIEIEIKRNQADIDKIHARVEQCRKYMNDNFFKINKDENSMVETNSEE
jgi:hypothetical protein